MIKSYKFKSKSYYLVQISFTDKHGKRHQNKFRKDEFGNRITSERHARELETKAILKLKKIDQNKYAFITFSDWLLTFLSIISLTHKSSTIYQYDGDLKKWLNEEFLNTPMTDFKKSDLHEFIFKYLPIKKATPHTQKRIMRNLRRVFEAAVEEGVINKNPVKGIKVSTPPTKKLVLNTKEAENLLREAKRVRHHFYHLWAFALLSGMRSGEMAGLRWSDIDEVTETIHITRQWTNKDGYHATKTNKNRVLPISGELKGLLNELKVIGPFKATLNGLNGVSDHFEDLVLPRFKEWTYGQASQVTKEFCKRIGITQVKFHDLRATFITNLLARGVSLAKVMALAGHSKTSTTDEYLRLAGVDVKGSTEMLGYSLPVNSDSYTPLSICEHIGGNR